ncbi:hypothetical protein [Bacillus litorisediminis]|uniref:hypothetical protein n=1 Tax=Bacillus litorisediminis TaxID=2922713 RepID=UPI001FAEA7B4|nr:hypothetical protein [Bacillus litorisediminis]
MKKFFWRGFLLFSLLSLGLYLVWFQVSHFRFERMNFDWVHIIPAGIFNAFTEIFTPSIPDFLKIIPLVLTDGIVGGIISIFIYFLLLKKDTINSWLLLVFFFVLYQVFIHFFYATQRVALVE